MSAGSPPTVAVIPFDHNVLGLDVFEPIHHFFGSNRRPHRVWQHPIQIKPFGAVIFFYQGIEGGIMAKETADAVYKVVEVIGTSTQSWEDAAKKAVETAAHTLRDLRIAEVVKMDMKVEDGKVHAYRTRVLLSFKYES
jgi:flavin-binding protein dodecin